MVPATEMTGTSGQAAMQLGERLTAVPAGQGVVEERQIEVVAGCQRRAQLVLRRDPGHLDLVPGPREVELLELGVFLAVVHAQQPEPRARRHISVSAFDHPCTAGREPPVRRRISH